MSNVSILRVLLWDLWNVWKGKCDLCGIVVRYMSVYSY